MTSTTSSQPKVTLAELGDFRFAKIPHHNYADAFARVWSLATRSTGAKVVIVAGPTGVGKSTLSASLLIQACKSAAGDPSKVPAVLVKAVPPHGQRFSWKEFYIRTLEQLREPLIDRKVWSHHQTSLLGPEIRGKTAADGLDTELLRRCVENAIRYRETKMLLVDEAHHMLMCQDPRRLVFQFETLKSLADMCNATLVLLGTYKLLMIRDYSAQLIRRSQIVHFPCYLHQQKSDRESFKSALFHFVGKMPIKLEAGLASDVVYFFVKTAGCVGILHELLRDALYEAAEHGAPLITREILDRVAQSNKAIKTIIEEAAEGILDLQDVESDLVRDLIKQTPQDIIASRALERCHAEPQAAPRRALSPSGRKMAPGQRRPTRDLVGGPAHVNLA